MGINFSRKSGRVPNETYSKINVYYLPPHPVFKSKSTTIQVIILFDASTHTQENLFLNAAFVTRRVDDFVEF